jgi:hypothetical protein
MQKEELSDSRNRQAAKNDRHQNEGQIWQRGLHGDGIRHISQLCRVGKAKAPKIISFWSVSFASIH